MMLPCWMAGGYPVPCRERMFPTMVRGSVDGTTLAGSRLRIGPIRRSTPAETMASSQRLQSSVTASNQFAVPTIPALAKTGVSYQPDPALQRQPPWVIRKSLSRNQRTFQETTAPTSRPESGRQSLQLCRAPRVLEDVSRPEALHERLPMEQVDPVFGSVQWVIADQIVIADQWVLPASGFGLQDAQ